MTLCPHLLDEVLLSDVSADVAHGVGGRLQHGVPGLLPLRGAPPGAGPERRALGGQLRVVVAVGVAPHAEHPGQPLQEEAPHPGGHGVVGGRGAVVHVDDKHRHDDGEGDEDHDEEQVLPDQRNDLVENRVVF